MLRRGGLQLCWLPRATVCKPYCQPNYCRDRKIRGRARGRHIDFQHRFLRHFQSGDRGTGSRVALGMECQPKLLDRFRLVPSFLSRFDLRQRSGEKFFTYSAVARSISEKREYNGSCAARVARFATPSSKAAANRCFRSLERTRLQYPYRAKCAPIATRTCRIVPV